MDGAYSYVRYFLIDVYPLYFSYSGFNVFSRRPVNIGSFVAVFGVDGELAAGRVASKECAASGDCGASAVVFKLVNFAVKAATFGVDGVETTEDAANVLLDAVVEEEVDAMAVLLLGVVGIEGVAGFIGVAMGLLIKVDDVLLLVTDCAVVTMIGAGKAGEAGVDVGVDTVLVVAVVVLEVAVGADVD